MPLVMSESLAGTTPSCTACGWTGRTSYLTNAQRQAAEHQLYGCAEHKKLLRERRHALPPPELLHPQGPPPELYPGARVFSDVPEQDVSLQDLLERADRRLREREARLSKEAMDRLQWQEQQRAELERERLRLLTERRQLESQREQYDAVTRNGLLVLQDDGNWLEMKTDEIPHGSQTIRRITWDGRRRLLGQEEQVIASKYGLEKVEPPAHVAGRKFRIKPDGDQE